MVMIIIRFSHKLLRKKIKIRVKHHFIIVVLFMLRPMDIYVKCPRDPLNPEKRLKSGEKFQKMIGVKSLNFIIPTSMKT